MNYYKKSLAILLLLAIIGFSHVAEARQYKLSQRTIDNFKEFKELVTDAQERLIFTNLILSVAPFKALLDGVGPDVAYEFKTTDWSLYSTAAQGIAINFRVELRNYCELEALAQHKSNDDFLFWRELSRQFYPEKKEFNLEGRWEKVLTQNDRGGTPVLVFRKSEGTYSGTFELSVEGVPISQALEDINVAKDSVSFKMQNGTTKISFILRYVEGVSSLTGRSSTPRETSNLTFKRI